MLDLFTRPWPWYVSGPLLGLCVPLLLILGNRQLGVSASLRAICAAVLPGRADFFRYDWKNAALWNLAFALGMLLGGCAMNRIGLTTPAISGATHDAITNLRLAPPSGLVPGDLFVWSSLLTVRGAIALLGGGFLVGFGSAYAGGCTSGHGIMGLATLQRASAIAMIGIFAGGMLGTFLIIPILFQ
jgi:uncharacterized membrane protein YedE/YeeE